MQFWMRSKTYMSKINPQRGKLTVENRKSREKKTDMLRSIGKQSGESVEPAQERFGKYHSTYDVFNCQSFDKYSAKLFFLFSLHSHYTEVVLTQRWSSVSYAHGGLVLKICHWYQDKTCVANRCLVPLLIDYTYTKENKPIRRRRPYYRLSPSSPVYSVSVGGRRCP